jgi:cholera toxin transcriptional activator
LSPSDSGNPEYFREASSTFLSLRYDGQAMAGSEKIIFRFGIFEADPSSGELRKSGMRVRLQEQPFQMLLMLVSRSGEIVTREEIRQKLWPSDTFVDFDHSVNTNINKVRDALGDSASHPRFIETLAKRGYRFLVPVDLVVFPATDSNRVRLDKKEEQTVVAPSTQASAPTLPAFSLSRVDELPAVSSGYLRALFLLIQIMYLVFYLTTLSRTATVQNLLERTVPAYAWVAIVVIVSASIGIVLRLYLISAVSFDISDLGRKFLKIFPAVLALDELWALAPFLLAQQIGLGLALGFAGALAYVPFAQRTLMLMRKRAADHLNSEK